MSQAKKFQILALSGGGVRGLYTASVLAAIEEHLSEKTDDPDYNIAKHFDLIAGTSIGGILALGLASGLNARKLKSVIDANRKEIFNKTFRKIPLLGRLLTFLKQSNFSLYSNKALCATLTSEFKKKLVGDLETRVVIPAVNGTSGEPKVYKTPHHAEFTKDYKISLVEVSLATSAAPTYFDPYTVEDKLMVDGGLIANSPALIAYHEATHFLKQPSDSVSTLFVGTLGSGFSLNSDRLFKFWGYIFGWGTGMKLLSLTLSSNEVLHNKLAEHLQPGRFIKIDGKITPEQSRSLNLDNASDKAATMLRGHGDQHGQEALANPSVMNFFEHTPSQITFYKRGTPYEVQRSQAFK